jgi:hypothetical protein
MSRYLKEKQLRAGRVTKSTIRGGIWSGEGKENVEMDPGKVKQIELKREALERMRREKVVRDKIMNECKYLTTSTTSTNTTTTAATTSNVNPLDYVIMQEPPRRPALSPTMMYDNKDPLGLKLILPD